MKKLSLLLCLLWFGAKAQTAEERIKNITTDIDQKFLDFKKARNISAVSYALVYNGEIIHSFHEGAINRLTMKEPNGQSAYRIASMSKSFAGVAVLQLRDAGKLRMDDPIEKYIPELKGQNYSPGSPDITIQHLLIHAAGLPEDNPWGDRQLGISQEQFLDLLNNGLSFSNDAGVTYEYSNTGFAILGLLIERVSGQPYQEFIRENIWKPLGMHNTYWEYRNVPKDNLVHGYRWVYEKFVEQPVLGDGAYGIMGGIISSTEDFAKYMGLHQSAYLNEIPDSPVLKKNSVKEMHFKWNFNMISANGGFKGNGERCMNASFYGYGLRIENNCDNIVMLGHSGGLPGYGSDWKIMPDYSLGIVSLSNGTYGTPSALNNEVLPYIVAKAGLKPYIFPVSDILKQRQNELYSLLPSWDGARQTDIFAENFFDDNYLEFLQRDTKAAFAEAGEIVNVHEIVPENALRGTFTVEGEKKNLKIRFTLSPENPAKIQAYRITVE